MQNSSSKAKDSFISGPNSLSTRNIDRPGPNNKSRESIENKGSAFGKAPTAKWNRVSNTASKGVLPRSGGMQSNSKVRAHPSITGSMNNLTQNNFMVEG